MSSGKITRQGRSGSPGSGEGPEYRSWLALVPPEEREAIAELVKKHKIKDYDDLVGFSQIILAEMIEGNITPAIAREARLWTEMMFTVLATKNSAMGTPEAAYSDVITALVQVRREAPKLQASYTTTEEFIDVEPEPIAANDE